MVRGEARAGVGFQARVGLSVMSLHLRPQWSRKFRALWVSIYSRRKLKWDDSAEEPFFLTDVFKENIKGWT